MPTNGNLMGMISYVAGTVFAPFLTAPILVYGDTALLGTSVGYFAAV